MCHAYSLFHAIWYPYPRLGKCSITYCSFASIFASFVCVVVNSIGLLLKIKPLWTKDKWIENLQSCFSLLLLWKCISIPDWFTYSLAESGCNYITNVGLEVSILVYPCSHSSVFTCRLYHWKHSHWTLDWKQKGHSRKGRSTVSILPFTHCLPLMIL